VQASRTGFIAEFHANELDLIYETLTWDAATHRNRPSAIEGDPTMKATSGGELAAKLGISAARGMEAVIKAQLISAVLDAAEQQALTHAEIAKRSGLPRSAVTGILSSSLQKITIDRVLKLVEAVGLVAEVKTKRARAA
jgi:predicted XRE-type DNA-binding protein